MSGRLSDNITFFARALRMAGLPLGPGAVIDAVTALELENFSSKEDFYWILHAAFVRKKEHSLIFSQAFSLFWRKRAFMDKLIAQLSPRAPSDPHASPKKPEAGALRVAEAFLPKAKKEEEIKEERELSARLTVSEREVLQNRDFAQMTSEQIAQARLLLSRMRLPDDRVKSRRFEQVVRGRWVDPRRSFRQTLRSGGAGISLAFRAPMEKHPPIVALCDISGSMADYTPLFLQFLHGLTEKRRRVETFLFGTRLTNVTRSLRRRDPDEALAACGQQVEDWSGGTRIGQALHRFNHDWARRVLGQGAVVILFSDGLEREGVEELEQQMARLHRSCRRLIWVNPLLRFDGFQARAQGVRAMLPHVDDFRPIHSLAAMRDLVEALEQPPSKSHDPRHWLQQVA